MRDWLKIDKDTIFKGNDENGNRYLSQFLSDYKKIFSPADINAGCERCLNDYYQKLIKHLPTMGKDKKKKEYVLKLKYNGIPLEFGSPVLVTNANVNEEYARKLIKSHPRGKDLFDVLPDSFDSDENENPFKGLSRDDLDKIATDLGLDPKDYANKGLVTDAIKAKQDELNSTDVNPEE